MPITPARARAPRAESPPPSVSLLGDHDLHLFNEGTHQRLYEKLGSHLIQHEGVAGAHFAVWAPEAEAVSVIGEFNGWAAGRTPLQPRAIVLEGDAADFCPRMQSNVLHVRQVPASRTWTSVGDNVEARKLNWPTGQTYLQNDAPLNVRSIASAAPK